MELAEDWNYIGLNEITGCRLLDGPSKKQKDDCANEQRLRRQRLREKKRQRV